jgi:hypothetical protein
MGGECCVRHAEVVDELAVSKDYNFLWKPLSAEKNGELIARGCDHDKPFPRIAAATAFNNSKLCVNSLQCYEAYKTAIEPLLDLLAMLVIAAESTLPQQQFIVARKADDAPARLA